MGITEKKIAKKIVGQNPDLYSMIKSFTQQEIRYGKINDRQLKNESSQFNVKLKIDKTMETEQAIKAAKHLIQDRKGANYYQDTKILANYLKGALNIKIEKAKEMAEAIQKDRNGANYYEDVEVLAKYLHK